MVCLPSPLTPRCCVLRCASDGFLLTKPNTFQHNRGTSVATFLWCLGSSRNAVRLCFQPESIVRDFVDRLTGYCGRKKVPTMSIHDKSLSRENGDFPAPGRGRPAVLSDASSFTVLLRPDISFSRPARTAVKAEHREFMLCPNRLAWRPAAEKRMENPQGEGGRTPLTVLALAEIRARFT